MSSAMTVLAAGVLVAAWAAPAAAQDPKVAKGEALFASQKCSLCHSVADKGNKKHPLDGMGKTLTADVVKMWLKDPKAAAAKFSKTGMPPMKSFATLPAEDVDAVVAYVLSLK